MVGLGAFGTHFVPLFKNHPLVSRIALCDQQPERVKSLATRDWVQDKFNPRDAFTKFEDLLKSDVDAVVIITQHWLHAPMSVQAMEAGKHVYCAVPLISIPDADEILGWCGRVVETQRRTGQLFMFGETTFYRPQTMYCRRRAAAGDFGDFVYAEGEYFHDVDHGLRGVKSHRLVGPSGEAHKKYLEDCQRRGILSGPTHYPTHSTGGPISVMNAYPVKVAAFGYRHQRGDPYFADTAFSNETALFQMSNGAHMRICEYREIGHPGRENFRVYGNKGSFEHGSLGDTWCDKKSITKLTEEEMRDPLPPEVVAAYRGHRKLVVADAAKLSPKEQEDFLGGHGGSHSYLVHEFCDAIAHERMPACTALDAARYTAAGAMAHKSALAGGQVLDVPDWGG
jgi:predicted dehydrogenase